MIKKLPTLLSLFLVLSIFLPTLAFAEPIPNTNPNQTTPNNQTPQIQIPETCQTVKIDQFRPEEYNLVGDFGGLKVWKHKEKDFVYNQVVVDNLIPLVPEPFRGVASAVWAFLNPIVGNKMVSIENNQIQCNDKASTDELLKSYLPQNQGTVPTQINDLVHDAKGHIGTSYIGNEEIIDCSKFVQTLVWRHIPDQVNKFPRITDQQLHYNSEGNVQTVLVPKEQLQPGDLVFFDTSVGCPACEIDPSITHVGIYIGNDEFVDSNNGSGVIQSHKLSTYSGIFKGGKRFIINN